MSRHRPLARVLDGVHREDIRFLTGGGTVSSLPNQSFTVFSPMEIMQEMYGKGRASLLGGGDRIPKDVRKVLNGEMPVRFSPHKEGE